MVTHAKAPKPVSITRLEPNQLLHRIHNATQVDNPINVRCTLSFFDSDEPLRKKSGFRLRATLSTTSFTQSLRRAATMALISAAFTSLPVNATKADYSTTVADMVNTELTENATQGTSFKPKAALTAKIIKNQPVI